MKFFKSNAIIVKKGAAIDIPAEVKGLPLPTIQWMKDDVVLEKPEDEKMTMETEEVRTASLDHRLRTLTTFLQSTIHSPAITISSLSSMSCLFH